MEINRVSAHSRNSTSVCFWDPRLRSRSEVELNHWHGMASLVRHMQRYRSDKLSVPVCFSTLHFSRALYVSFHLTSKPNLQVQYRVTKVTGHMGWVDFEFGRFTVCPILLGQMGIWQNRKGNMVDHPI